MNVNTFDKNNITIIFFGTTWLFYLYVIPPESCKAESIDTDSWFKLSRLLFPFFVESKQLAFTSKVFFLLSGARKICTPHWLQKVWAAMIVGVFLVGKWLLTVTSIFCLIMKDQYSTCVRSLSLE